MSDSTPKSDLDKEVEEFVKMNKRDRLPGQLELGIGADEVPVPTEPWDDEDGDDVEHDPFAPIDDEA